MSLISEELGADSAAGAKSLSLGSLDTVSVRLETRVTPGVVLLLDHIVCF